MLTKPPVKSWIKSPIERAKMEVQEEMLYQKLEEQGIPRGFLETLFPVLKKEFNK